MITSTPERGEASIETADMSTATDWSAIRSRLAGALSKEDERILDLLVSGESTPAIARAMGQHRSMIWRKAQQLRMRAVARQTD